jgi:hypothetical protein
MRFRFAHRDVVASPRRKPVSIQPFVTTSKACVHSAIRHPGETLCPFSYSSPRRRPGSSNLLALIVLGYGLRRNDATGSIPVNQDSP